MASAKTYLGDNSADHGGLDELDQLRTNHILTLSWIKPNLVLAYSPVSISSDTQSKEQPTISSDI